MELAIVGWMPGFVFGVMVGGLAVHRSWVRRSYTAKAAPQPGKEVGK